MFVCAQEFDAACRWPAGVGDALNTRNSLSDSISIFFHQLNGAILPPKSHRSCDAGRRTVISFSHFLPRPDLYTPWKRFVTEWLCFAIPFSALSSSSGLVDAIFIRYPAFRPLLAVMGCPRLGNSVAELCPDIHVFGHSHVHFDGVIDLACVPSSANAETTNSNSPRDEEQATPSKNTETECRFIHHPLAYPHERKRRPKLSTPAAERNRVFPKDIWTAGVPERRTTFLGDQQ